MGGRSGWRCAGSPGFARDFGPEAIASAPGQVDPVGHVEDPVDPDRPVLHEEWRGSHAASVLPDVAGIRERPGRASRIGASYRVLVSVGRASRTPAAAQSAAKRSDPRWRSSAPRAAATGPSPGQPGVAHDEPAVGDVGDPAAQEPGEVGAGRQVVDAGEVGVVGDPVRPEAAQQRARPEPGDRRRPWLRAGAAGPRCGRRGCGRRSARAAPRAAPRGRGGSGGRGGGRPRRRGARRPRPRRRRAGPSPAPPPGPRRPAPAHRGR